MPALHLEPGRLQRLHNRMNETRVAAALDLMWRSVEDGLTALLKIVVDSDEMPEVRLHALRQVAVDPIGQSACQHILDSRHWVMSSIQAPAVDLLVAAHSPAQTLESHRFAALGLLVRAQGLSDDHRGTAAVLLVEALGSSAYNAVRSWMTDYELDCGLTHALQARDGDLAERLIRRMIADTACSVALRMGLAQTLAMVADDADPLFEFIGNVRESRADRALALAFVLEEIPDPELYACSRLHIEELKAELDELDFVDRLQEAWCDQHEFEWDDLMVRIAEVPGEKREAARQRMMYGE